MHERSHVPGDDVGVGQTGMNRICVPVRPAMGERSHEQDVGQLGNSVFVEAIKGSGAPLEPVKVDALDAEVNRAGHNHDAGAGSKGATQMMGEHEVPQMVHSELELETICGDASCCSNAGVVDEDVELAAGGSKRAASIPGRLERGKVEMEKLC